MTNTTRRFSGLLVFLWVSVVAWGIGLGAKLFEFTVVISAWAAAPPASLSLMPYGSSYPHDPGDFFLPLSIVLLIGAVGALVSGKGAARTYRIWLWVSLASLLVIWAATPTIFWPMIADLYYAGTGARPLDTAAAQDLVSRWLVLDWLRTLVIAVGLASSVQAMSSHHRAGEA